MTFISRTVAWAIALAAASAPAIAQRVRGTVVYNETGAPVAGAIVSAFSGKDTAGVMLSRSDGSFLLALPARKELTLLVRAIGLQPIRIQLSAGTDTAVVVRMTHIALRLATVSVSVFTSCAKTQTGTANIFDVWQEVTTALENTKVARQSKRYRFNYWLYEARTDAATGRIHIMRSDTSSWLATRPFKVTPAKELASDGYIVDAGAVSWYYRAPDEMVLLDESFQKTHCFWASNGSEGNQDLIGVYFMPVSGIRINDIRGVFWIDAHSYELKRLDYIYTQIKPASPQQRAPAAATTPAAEPSADSAATGDIVPGLRNPEPGGIIQFQKLPDGTFIVPRWSIFQNDAWRRQVTPRDTIRPIRILQETRGVVLGMTGGG